MHRKLLYNQLFGANITPLSLRTVFRDASQIIITFFETKFQLRFFLIKEKVEKNKDRPVKYKKIIRNVRV